MKRDPNTETPFKVADGYFEKTSVRLKQIALESTPVQKPKGKVIRLVPFIVSISAAACLVFFFLNRPSQDQPLNFEDIDQEILADYLVENPANDLTPYIANEALAETMSDQLDELDIDDEQLEEFLLEENDELLFDNLL
jgi:hypothetical protein